MDHGEAISPAGEEYRDSRVVRALVWSVFLGATVVFWSILGWVVLGYLRP